MSKINKRIISAGKKKFSPPKASDSVKNAYVAQIAQYEKEIYDLKQMLEISRSLCTTLDLPTLIESIIYTTMAQMRVLGAGIFILDQQDNNLFKLDTNFSGLDPDPDLKYEIPSDCNLMKEMTLGNILTLKELEEKFPEDEYLELISSLNPSLIVPLITKNHPNGILLLGERISIGDTEELYTDYEKKEAKTIASLAAIAIYNASLVELSSTDMMTHFKLKYYFFNILTDKLDNAFAQNKPISILMFDIDFFKKFNDTYGHACGDYVLQSVANIIRSGIRSQDMASRYGGEEFTVMLNDTDKDEAVQVAERIRKTIEENDFFYEEQHMKVTISIGVSVFSVDNNPVSTPQALVKQADQALYMSKRNGRNRVTYADPAILALQDDN